MISLIAKPHQKQERKQKHNEKNKNDDEYEQLIENLESKYGVGMEKRKVNNLSHYLA